MGVVIASTCTLQLPHPHNQRRRYLQCKNNICNYIKGYMISSESLRVGLLQDREISQATRCRCSIGTIASLPQIYEGTWQMAFSCPRGGLMIISMAIIWLFSKSRCERVGRLHKHLETDCIDRATLESTIILLSLNSIITMWKWSKRQGLLRSDTKGRFLTVGQSRWVDDRDGCSSRAS